MRMILTDELYGKEHCQALLGQVGHQGMRHHKAHEVL